MKRLLNKITDTLADAALLEMGVALEPAAAHGHTVAAESPAGAIKRFFQNFSITMADAALLEIGLPAVLSAENQEEVRDQDIVRPDECQYGDNDKCFRHAA